LRQGAFACLNQRGQTGVSRLRASNNALSNPFANIVLRTVWPALASFVQRYFHRSHRSAVKLFNDHFLRISAAGLLLRSTPFHGSSSRC
jgi:hypothetical protein